MAGAFQPVPDTVQVAVQSSLNGQKVENLFYAHVGEAVTAAIVEEIADIVATWFVNTLLPSLSSNVVYTRTVATDLSAEASYQSIDTTGAGTTGGLGASSLPNNASIAIHRDTGLSGKKAKSRIYLYGLAPSDEADANTLTPAAAAALQGIFVALDTALAEDGTVAYESGYPQRVINGVKLAAANFIPTIGWSFVDRVLDSQRRRLPGRGQ